MTILWRDEEGTPPASVEIRGRAIGRGSRVLLRPRPGGDILDLALDGKAAHVQAIEQDVAGALYLAVTVDDDPGRDLGDDHRPGHRFFFSVDEVEPLDGGEGDREATAP
jgi:hypothetical protein